MNAKEHLSLHGKNAKNLWKIPEYRKKVIFKVQ
jgi:hypothetical protein